MENQGLPMPKTDVSYGATRVFIKHFPDEADKQEEAFNAPTWQTRTSLPAPPPHEVKVPPRGITQQELADPVLVFKDQNPVDHPLATAMGAIFFAVVAYLIFRGVQWHIAA
jgi:hypothetical protein